MEIHVLSLNTLFLSFLYFSMEGGGGGGGGGGERGLCSDKITIRTTLHSP